MNILENWFLVYNDMVEILTEIIQVFDYATENDYRLRTNEKLEKTKQ